MAGSSRAEKATEIERLFHQELERARAELKEELQATYEIRGARLALRALLEVGAIGEGYQWAIRRWLEDGPGASLWIDGCVIVPPRDPESP